MEEKKFKLLNTINNFNNLSQRDLAKECNISLGKINALIKKFTEEELVYRKELKNNKQYKLTKKALRLLENKIKEDSLKKINLYDDPFKKVKQAVILAAGEKKEFGKPIGLIEIENTTIIERTINILKNNGIEKIVVVVGYESNYFEELAKKQDLILVKNEKYKWTGTMASLALAKNYIMDDFLLIENDIVFEERAIEEIMTNKHRDCLLITNETGSGDEAFVEIRDGFIFKVSKDIHMFNNIDGELVGVTKISYKVFNKMLEAFEGNKNPYLNYEYALLDVSRNYNIGYTKIDDLIWFEIDNKEHYEKVQDRIYPMIKRRELEFRNNIVKECVKNALNLEDNQIGKVMPSGGMTNKNYKVYINDNPYIVRIPGNGTDEIIDRKSEKTNAKLAVELGLDKKILYINENSGVKIAEFIKDAETLTATSAKREKNMKKVARILNTLHNSDIKMENIFDAFRLMDYYEDLIKKYNGEFYDGYEEVKEKVFLLKKELKNLNVELMPCHNDTLPDNFVKDSKENMYLIDWEYSGKNDPIWDVTAYMLESEFSEDEEELFLNIYFDNKLNEDIFKRVLINKICQDFLWSLWTILKEAKGDDFGTYGIERYKRAVENIRILALRSN